MGYITVGGLIEKIRIEKSITRKRLVQGICSEQTLYEIENDKINADVFMLDLLLQRLGKSPDKLEMILTSEAYRTVRMRDLLEEAILRGKRNLAEALLQKYPCRTKTDQMYIYRMRAGIWYRINHNYINAAKYLQKAIDLTLPEFTYDKIEEFLISTAEMENLLAFERVRIEKAGGTPSVMLADVKTHIEACIVYIEKHFEDVEERAKLLGKGTWLLGRLLYQEGSYMQTLILCEKGIEGLRRNNILYFMLPLLELAAETGAAMGIAPEGNKWVKYKETVAFLWDAYVQKWYPTDFLFHNCYQKEYHLDYEWVRAERKAKGMTQEEFAQDVYQNVESLSRFETGKTSPNKKTFEKFMEKLGMNRGRYCGYVVTESFEIMELRRRLDTLVTRRDYRTARELLEKLRTQLDMEIEENQSVVVLFESIIGKYLKEISTEQALEQQKSLLNGLVDLDKPDFRRTLTRNEALLINNICIMLCDLGRREDAIHLFEGALQRFWNSRVGLKYRYRSYALLLNNYVHERVNSGYACGEYICEGIKYELLCGKGSTMPLCINNILITLSRSGHSREECDMWAKAMYYMSDLYYFEEEKEAYRKFFREKRQIEL